MPKYKVLIAEDDADLRQLLQLLLEREGFDVLAAGDGATALWLLSERHPDLILTDLLMPQVDGIELINDVRNRAELADLPILAMTAYGDDHLAKAYGVGATATLPKPLDFEYLVRTIKENLPEHTATAH